jgi:hypothetical protein
MGSRNVIRHEEKYCIWSGISIRGIPLEEATEKERISSIIGSIVWCCPTSRVFYNKSVVFIYYSCIYSGVFFI